MPVHFKKPDLQTQITPKTKACQNIVETFPSTRDAYSCASSVESTTNAGLTSWNENIIKIMKNIVKGKHGKIMKR